MKADNNLHWINGGTGLTNMTHDSLPEVEEALRRYGKDDVFISEEPIEPLTKENSDCFSLHIIGSGDRSEFWDVYRQVRAERGLSLTSSIAKHGD